MGSDYGQGGKAEKWAKEHGLDSGVDFLGQQSYSALLNNLAESDLLLHPSLEETFSMSIAEAMSLGVPVVGGRSSGAVPWVIGGGGVVVDVTSPSAMKDAMLALISNSAEYRRYSQTANSRVQESFTANHVASTYETIYKLVVSRTKNQYEERLMA
jgi:glycosyltransferase involved in cell wall biosynthesis